MTTRAQLRTSVDNLLIRNDVAASADFDEMLLVAEAEISRRIRAAVQEQSTDLVFTGREQDLPADFLEIRDVFNDDTTRKINYMTPKVLRESSAWNDGRVGSFYTVQADLDTGLNRIVIAGPASASSPLTLTVDYYARYPALVGSTDTNWLLTNHFDAYLYATTRAAAEFIQEDALEDRFAGKFDKVVEELSRHENRKRWNAAPKQPYGSPRTIV